MQKQQKCGRKEKKKEREREREKKKKKKKWRCKLADPGCARPGRSTTQVAAWPRSPTPISVSRFFFFFSLSNDLMNTYSLWFVVVYFAVVVVVFFIFFLDVNWILETQFLGRYHVKKVPHQTWTTHENWIPKTQFIDPKLSLLNSRC